MTFRKRFEFWAWKRRKMAELTAYRLVMGYAEESEDGDILRLCKRRSERLAHEVAVAELKHEGKIP